MRRVAPWIVLPAVVALASAPLRAGEDPAVRDAQARFEEGLERVKAGDYEAARISFAQAYAVLKRPAILWNLALAEEKTGNWVSALTHFKRVARDSSATAADREDAQRHAAALWTRTAHVEVQAPSGAAFRVDGDPLDAVAPLPEPIDVAPGRHVIEASWADGKKVIAIEALAGQTARVRFGGPDANGGGSAIAALPPPPPAAAGPSPVEPLAPGMPSPEEHGAAPRSPTATGRIVATASLGGAAVAAVAVGVALALESHSKANEAASDLSLLNAPSTGYASCYAMTTTTCTQLNDATRAENRDTAWSDAMYVTGAVLAAGAVAVWLLWPKTVHEPVRAAWLMPAIGPSELGLRAGARF